MTRESLHVVIVGGTTLPVRCAEILREEGHAVQAFVSEDPDVAAWASEAGIPCLEPGAPDLAARLAGSRIDWLVSANNLWVIPPDVLESAARGAVNFHDAPLPRYSGLNAPTWGILEGASDWEVTWHLIQGGVDEGDVLLRQPVEIEAADTSLTLNTRCYEGAIGSFRQLVRGLANGTLEPHAQDLAERVYYARDRRPPAAATLRWDRPAEELGRTVRALDFGGYENPLGLPKIFVGDDALVVTRLEGSTTTDQHVPGTVLAVHGDALEVAVADGLVRLSGIRHQTGLPVDLLALEEKGALAVGKALSVRSSDELDEITTYHEAIARHEGYWKKRLGEASPLALPALELASEHDEAQTTVSSQTLPPTLGRDLVAAGSTVSHGDLVVGVVVAFLARISGNSRFDIAYRELLDGGTPGRDEALFETHVPLPVDAPADEPASDCIRAVVDALEAVRARGTHARDLCARAEVSGADSFPVAVRQAVGGDATPFGAALTLVVRDDGTRIDWVADPARIDPDDVKTLRDQLTTFVDDLASDPERPLGRLSALGEDELERVVHLWNATDVDYPADALIHGLISEQATRAPDRLAVACRGVELTFEELEERAARMARRLRASGVERGTRVGVCMERSADLVVVLLAVLKTGAAYVPLDPAYPAERIAFMVDDSAPVAVVGDQRSAALLAGRQDVVVVEDAGAAGEHAEESIPAGEGDSADLAYVIYTSGSTGRPKGVMVSHRNVANFFVGMDAHVQHEPPGTLLAVTSISFDISVLELFWTLSRGFTVVVHDGDPLVDVDRKHIDFSLFFFASDDVSRSRERYRLVTEAARFADRHGFSAVWTPERHFHAFGGLFPNPAVTSAMIAAVTERIQIRAGSVVAPLHNPIRIAEEWAFVDNISNGRVGISFASGWQPDDFVLAPENFLARKEVMFEHIDIVHRLWRGEAVAMPGHGGRQVDVRILPRPVQETLPTWITAAGNPETFRAAGATGFGILTHLLGQTVAELGTKIAVYREARRDAGLDPDGGQVVLMLHAFVGDDEEAVREAVREPLKAYLRSSVELIQRAAWSFPTFRQRSDGSDGAVPLDKLSAEELDEVLEFSFARYFETSGLLGTPDRCVALVHELRSIGVDEIACLIDFHGDTDTELAALPHLDRVRERVEAANRSSTDASIPGLIARYGVTHMQCTPSLAAILVQTEPGRIALSGLQQLLVGGEAFPPALAKTLRELVEGDVLNMYGPTETTIWSSVYRLEDGDEDVSIGRPIANTKLYVLDESMQPLPVGGSGELYIGGAGVVPGYLERPELTAERFVADPFGAAGRVYRTGDLVRYRRDGNLEFLGRIDHQVKIRGYRVEIGEIEAELARHEDVREAVVVARPGPDDSTTLVAYVAGGNGKGPSVEALRAHLRRRLPEFMIPQRFDALAELPRTPNGKIDRAALPEPGTTERPRDIEQRAPEDSLERILAGIWETELDIHPIGTDESFFDLGGHSLLAVRIFTQIENRFGVRLPLASLFRAPTIGELAVSIRASAPADVLAQLDEEEAPGAAVNGDIPRPATWESLVPIRPHGDRPPLFLVHAHGGNVLFYSDLVRRLDPAQPVYGLQAHGVDGVLEPLESFEEMARRYLEEVRTVQPHGPYKLGGDCLGGVLAYEMAQQLVDAGEEVELVTMVDSFHPQYRPHVAPSLYGVVHQARTFAALHVPALRRLERRERWRYLRTKGAAAGKMALEHLPFSTPAESADDPLLRTRDALGRAFDAYRPRPYDGDVLLFRSRRQPWGITPDPMLGWKELVPRLETREIDAYFQCGVLEPAVAELAPELDRRLGAPAGPAVGRPRELLSSR